MGKENIINRIIADAENEAAAIIAEAEKRAQDVISSANLRAERNLAGTKAEAGQKVKAIIDGKSATARLDCAKCELKEKRRVIDAVYEKALEQLVALDKKTALGLAERLLSSYAEEGDEIVFAANYKFAEDVSVLRIVKEKKLTVSQKDGKIEGGFILRGKIADKDVSYRALLDADREENVAVVAAKLFNAG